MAEPIPGIQCSTALLGLAVGDAFGCPFEYHPKAAELARYSLELGRYLDSWEDVGQRNIKWCRKAGIYSDDTQQAKLLVLARLKHGAAEPAARFFYETCVEMMKTPGGSFGVHRGTGGNFRTAIATGKPVDTAGLGAPMRVGPVAVLFNDPQEMVEWVLTVSATTTSNPVSLACVAKFATVAWVLANPKRRDEILTIKWPEDRVPSDVWRASTAALRVIRDEGEEGLLQFATMTGWANKDMRCAANGFALTGVPWAINQALTTKSFGEALVASCSSGGDTDTVAAMTGCLAALKFGEGAIPAWMLEGLHGIEHTRNIHQWDPINDEAALTLLDVEYRKELYARLKPVKKPKLDTPEEGIDLFDLAEEAFAEEAAAAVTPPEPVLFYGHRNPNGEFSNFFGAPFVLDGETWPTVEHYFVAQKAPDDAEFQAEVRATTSPGRVKQLGRTVKIRDGWDDIKYDLMFKAVRAKFEQNAALRANLLATEDRPLHENCKDPWWGGGPNFKGGRDWLGQILMDVRDLLRGGG
jgi:hypothetical protein